jgi:hypothetical protein
MTDQEAKQQATRVEKYRSLNERLTQLLDLREQIGTENASPFTGDYRESRQVQSLKIKFSKTRGGAPASDLTLSFLGINAYDFGQFLRKSIETQLAAIREEITQL